MLGATAMRGEEGAGLVADALHGAPDERGPAARALALLCETDQAIAGHLYLMRGDRLEHAASHAGAARDAELDRFVEGYFRQQLDDVGMSAGLTVATQFLPSAGAWTDRRGGVHHLLTISCRRAQAVVYVGVAVLQLRGAHARPSQAALGLTAAIAAQLLELNAAAGCSAAIAG